VTGVLHAELRKDKRQRSVGSVTPGGGQSTSYNIAAVRGRGDNAPSAPSGLAPLPAVFANSNSATQQAASSVAAAAATTNRVGSAAPQVVNPARQPFVPRPMNASVDETSQAVLQRDSAGPAYTADATDSGMENNAILNAQQDLMNRILEEEDELIQSHRKAIEETMNTVRSEMNLLAEVDQPGSAIDTYVVKLKEILDKKDRAIQSLRAKLMSFEAQLQEEEAMNRSMGQQYRAR
jgi:kinesin family member 2/24